MRSNLPDQINQVIGNLIQHGTLVRLSVVKGKGVHLSIPCRILQYDESNQTITIYHVDEKNVHTYSLNEIDDFQAFN